MEISPDSIKPVEPIKEAPPTKKETRQDQTDSVFNQILDEQQAKQDGKKQDTKDMAQVRSDIAAINKPAPEVSQPIARQQTQPQKKNFFSGLFKKFTSFFRKKPQPKPRPEILHAENAISPKDNSRTVETPSEAQPQTQESEQNTENNETLSIETKLGEEEIEAFRKVRIRQRKAIENIEKDDEEQPIKKEMVETPAESKEEIDALIELRTAHHELAQRMKNEKKEQEEKQQLEQKNRRTEEQAKIDNHKATIPEWINLLTDEYGQKKSNIGQKQTIAQKAFIEGDDYDENKKIKGTEIIEKLAKYYRRFGRKNPEEKARQKILDVIDKINYTAQEHDKRKINGKEEKEKLENTFYNSIWKKHLLTDAEQNLKIIGEYKYGNKDDKLGTIADKYFPDNEKFTQEQASKALAKFYLYIGNRGSDLRALAKNKVKKAKNDIKKDIEASKTKNK